MMENECENDGRRKGWRKGRNMREPVVSRRKFLEVTAFAGLASAVGGSALVGLTEEAETAFAAESETKIVKTCCRCCVGRCGVLAHVRNGRVVKLEGDPDQQYSKGRMCSKGLSGIQMLYNPNRIKYPLKRAGERGENKWERISWDQALDEIADILIEVDQKYGPETLIVGHGGGGHTYLGEDVLRFLHVYGSPNVFEPGGMQCLEPRMHTQTLLSGVFESDLTNCAWPEVSLTGKTEMKALVMWGTNPGWSCTGQAGRPVAEARAQGLKTVVVDPRMTADASKADVWLPIRPQTDVALMLCWIKYIIDNDLYDHDAVLRWTNLPYLVNPQTKLCLRPADIGEEGGDYDFVVWDRATNSAKVMAYPFDEALDPALDDGPHAVDGMECKTGFQLLRERCEGWTIEKAAEVCWLDAGKIEEAVRIYAENSPSAMSSGMAADHCALSTQLGMGQLIMEALLGNFCRPGALIQMFDGGDNPYSAWPGTLEHFLSKEQYLKLFGVTEYKMNASMWAHNHTLQEAMLTGQPYQPRVYIERSGNKMINMPNAARWEEAVKKMDVNVHMYMYPTASSLYADYLLPSTEWLEIYWTASIGNHVHVYQPATHLWEGMEEPMFWSLLAKRMAAKGHQRFIDSMDPQKCLPTKENLPEGFTKDIGTSGQITWWDNEEEKLDMLFASRGGMSYRELCDYVQEHGYYETTSAEEYLNFGAHEKIDEETGLPNGFNTASKKIEAYGDSIVTLGRTGAPYSLYELPPASVDYDPLPYYREPEESPLNPEYADYPLLLTGGHLPRYLHGTGRNLPWQRERHPVSELWINPVDAEKYGIEHGDWVWLESKRGKTQGKAKVTMQVGPGITYMERWWFPENLESDTGGWHESNVNLLTNDGGPFNDMIGSATYRGFMIKVSKADNPPAGIWTEPEQFEAWLPRYDEAETTDVETMVGGA